MIKKLLVIIALFSAPHMIQSAERKTPPTDKAQPKSGSFQRRPRSAAAQTQPTPPTTPQANQPQMLERHQSGDLSALIASYREAEGLPPTRGHNPAPTAHEELPSYREHMERTALSLMLPDASQASAQPKKGSLARRPQSAASANPSQPTPPASISPDAHVALPPTMITEYVSPQVQRPRRSSGEKPPQPAFWQTQQSVHPEDASTGAAKQILAPRKPAGESNSPLPVLKSCTNLFLDNDQRPASAPVSDCKSVRFRIVTPNDSSKDSTPIVASPNTIEEGKVFCEFFQLEETFYSLQKRISRLQQQVREQYACSYQFNEKNSKANSEEEKKFWNGRISQAQCAEQRLNYHTLEAKIRETDSELTKKTLIALQNTAREKVEEILGHPYTSEDDNYNYDDSYPLNDQA